MATVKSVKGSAVSAKGIDGLLAAIKKDISKDFAISAEIDENVEFLSTGNAGINYAFSGRSDGGFPIGLISEVAGLNATGKTLIAQHAMMETQQRGGIGVLVDSEYGFQPSWFRKLGGDPGSLIIGQPEYAEQAYDMIKATIISIREKDTDIPITVVYDSVAASPSKTEWENSLEKSDMGKRAIAHGKGSRLLMGLTKKHNVTFIIINQLRHTFAMYGPEMDTIGGEGWKYACSLRVMMKKGKQILVKSPGFEKGKPIGIHGSLRVTKNRLRAPFAEADFDIFWDLGIDPLSGLFTVLVQEGIFVPRKREDGTSVAGWWSYKDEDFQEASFSSILTKYPELSGGLKPIVAPTDISIGAEESDADVDM